MTTQTDELLAQIIAQLDKANNTGKPWIYVTDVLSVPTTTSTVDLALAAPIAKFTTNPQPMYLNTVALGWDTNTATNFKYWLVIEGITDANASFKSMSLSAQSINILDNNIVPIPANAQITLYAYNFNSGTVAGKMQLYMLGFLQK